jgi:hypothetical protein
MQTASLPPDSFLDVLARLPPDLDLDALALSTKAIQRARKVIDGRSLLRLAMARGPGGLSLNQTAAWAAMSGLAKLSDPGLKKRLDKAVPFLKALMEQQLAERAGCTAIRWPKRSLRMVDGSNINQPASQGTDWRVHAGYDLGGGGFFHLELTDNRGAETIERGVPAPGEIRIGDRNYANAGALHAFRQQSANQADFIVRVRWKSFILDNIDGTPFNLTEYLGTLPVDRLPREVSVRARVGKTRDLPLRLIIQRNTPEAIENIRRHLRRTASRRRRTLDPRTLVAGEFIILATSLPAEGYPAEDVMSVYRLRWQIELAFKRLKSLLHIDLLPTRTPEASRSWLYAHLILALLCDDLSQEFLESSPSGPC